MDFIEILSKFNKNHKIPENELNSWEIKLFLEFLCQQKTHWLLWEIVQVI